MSRRRARARSAAAERRARRRSFLAVAAVIVGVLVVAVLLLTLLDGGRDLDTEAAPVEGYPYPVQMLPPDPGARAHFPPGQTYNDYNSSPPTSGPHTATTAPQGVSDIPVPKEMAVHNMEHGDVVVWYNCSGGPQPLGDAACTDLRNQLAAVVTDAIEGEKGVLMTPYDGMDQRIALTAWQFLDAFEEFDAERVRTFIDTFYCHTNLEGFCQ